jgi:Ca2+-transporting ATPase
MGLVEQNLRTDRDTGLSAAEARTRLEQYGPNRLPRQDVPGPVSLLLRQFRSLLIYVLFVAAAISLVLGDIAEFAAIVLIAVLNAALGFVQEYRAERALAALQAMSAPSAGAMRGGVSQRIPAGEIVPGDVLLLEDGDIVAADGRLFTAVGLAAGEALLTGESLPLDKTVDPVAPGTPLAERSCMVYQGTLITRGRGRAIVVKTGAESEMGRIASHVAAQPRMETPLQRELAHVGRYLVVAACVLCFGVFLVGVARGIAASEMFLTAASLAVAAIPEGLPGASTVVLALGVQRMASRNALVRRLSSVETLGSVTLVFTDKTGTLTQNSMRVEQAWLAGQEPDLLRIAYLCNNATLGENGGPDGGDPTEIALLAYVNARDLALRRASTEVREIEIPFDAARARMTVVVKREDGSRLALTKGATQRVLEACTFIGDAEATGERREEVLERAAEMARRGLRVLALAHRLLREDESDPAQIESGQTLVGLICMADPLRPEAEASIRQAQEAGIQVVMLTGDQRETAASIGAALGLRGEVTTGAEVDELDLEGLRQRVAESSIFARVTSEHKLRIIQAAREEGHIVAMTGDGVNDAPALRAADIGVAMGRGGTDVARESSDLVLADDNFSTIVAAVEEGRTIHANIRRFIHFLLACNAAEVTVVFLALVLAGDAVLTPVQILFVNLLTDGLPALALGLEPASARVMQQPPRPRGRGLITALSLTPILGLGSVIAASSLAAHTLGHVWGTDDLAASMTFVTLVGAQLAASLVFRSETESVLSMRRNPWLLGALAASVLAMVALFYVPALRDVFDTEMLSVEQWLVVAALSLAPLAAGELVKASGLLRRYNLLPHGA